MIGDRAHGELSINGVRIDEKGPKTKNALNDLVDVASQSGVTMTYKDMKEALKYSNHKMYKKLQIKTNIGKLKILPLNGGKFYSESFAGGGVEFPLPTDENPNVVELDKREHSYSYYSNKALRHHVGRERVKERAGNFPGLHCNEAGWVDIMEFLHHGWIFDHEKVKENDDGLIPSSFREDRVN